MPQAIFIDNNNTSNTFTFFYESEGFYFSETVDSMYPFRGPGRQPCTVVYASDFNRSLEDWARIVTHIKPSQSASFMNSMNEPGRFFPRMWRGEMQNLDSTTLAESQAVLSKAIVAGELIVERLFDLFSYIEPAKSNQHVFSHKMRELLLLSSMEVESGWTAVLGANGYNITDRLSTNDYIKILNPLLLSKYQVEFPMYPEIGIVSPFKDWHIKSPTKSLLWYDAYNNTKHNREDNFHFATLENAILSVCGVAVMLCAQFGPEAVPHGMEVTLKEIEQNWPYIPLANAVRNSNADGSTQGIQWNTSSTWKKILYKF
jgi:hypothetical protein